MERSHKQHLSLWIEDLIQHLRTERPAVFLAHAEEFSHYFDQVPEKIIPPLAKEAQEKTVATPRVEHPAQAPEALFSSPLAEKKAEVDPLIDVKKTLQKLQIVEILEDIPTDALAKKKQQAYLFEGEMQALTILRIDEQGVKEQFLEDLAFAMSLYFAPAKVASYKDRWDLETLLKKSPCKCFIVQKSSLFTCRKLLAHYQENGDGSRAFLCTIPVILLEDLHLYFAEPAKKRSLWTLLQNTLPDLL